MGKLELNSTGWWNKDFAIQFFFGALVAVLYTYVVVTRSEHGYMSDFGAHANIAKGLLYGDKSAPPHFLYQIILVFLHKIAGLSFVDAGFIFVFVIVLITSAIAYRGIQKSVDVNKYFIGFSVLFLLLSHPVFLLAPLDKHLYFGYIASNVYHNPTILLLKPIALLHFIFICKLFHDAPVNTKTARIISLAVLTVLSIIAKPNYIIVFIPAAMGILLIDRYFLDNDFKDKVASITISVFIPAVIFLLLQFIWFYGGESKNSIGFGPFAVFQYLSALWMLIPKLLLSVLFPVAVVGLLGIRLLRRLDFQLSFLMFLIALIYSYLLVDGVNNKGIGHGNFFWSAQIAHFLLLYVCIKNYIEFLYDKKSRLVRFRTVPLIVGFLQLVSGLLWYYSNVNPDFWGSW